MNGRVILQISLIFIFEAKARKAPAIETEVILKDKPNNEDAEVVSFESQFFQDIFTEHVAPNKLHFGHVYENPSDWEQRFEEKDFSENRHRGKIKWGDMDGAYGEYYWDLNH